MDVMFSNILHYLTHGMTGVWNRSHPALPVDEAMRQAAMMTATNPACLGGVDTGKNRTGQIAKGFLADFTVGRLQRRRQQSEYSIQRVFRQGAQVR